MADAATLRARSLVARSTASQPRIAARSPVGNALQSEAAASISANALVAAGLPGPTARRALPSTPASQSERAAHCRIHAAGLPLIAAGRAMGRGPAVSGNTRARASRTASRAHRVVTTRLILRSAPSTRSRCAGGSPSARCAVAHAFAPDAAGAVGTRIRRAAWFSGRAACGGYSRRAINTGRRCVRIGTGGARTGRAIWRIRRCVRSRRCVSASGGTIDGATPARE